ncbi:MAG: LysM peptidoglycan-binding domain-containing protein [Planctomycetes bacterium]|nr:LysM peptidoglycan-binding domain-containing protein [Planctomycetota bacterium]
MKTEKLLLGAIGVAVVGILGIVVFSEEEEPRNDETSADAKILSTVTGAFGSERSTELGSALRNDERDTTERNLDLTIGAPATESVAWTVPASVRTFREVGYHFHVDPSEAEKALAMLNPSTSVDPDQLVAGEPLRVPAAWTGAVARNTTIPNPGIENAGHTTTNGAGLLRRESAVSHSRTEPEPWEFLVEPADPSERPITAGATPARFDEPVGQPGDYPVVGAPRGRVSTGTVSGTPKAGQSYTIRDGDSLWSIAKAAYGQGTLWNAIYDANRNVLPNPNALTTGKVILIPAR